LPSIERTRRSKQQRNYPTS